MRTDRADFMKLLIVILCYRVPELTIDCLRSLESEIDRVPGAQVAVCENGTGGDSAERIQRAIDENGWGSWVQLTEVYPNRGFTGGNNYILRENLQSDDPAEYFLLLNSDTLVLEHALDTLVNFMDAHPRVGIAGSQLLWHDGSVQASPFRFYSVLSELNRGLQLGLLTKLLPRSECILPKTTTPAPADWVCGASMILRRSMLEEIGLLDEGLYTYFDDIDICFRARQAGWETWYVPESRVVHLEGSTTGVVSGDIKRRPSYWFEARRRFFLKNYGAFNTAMADAAFLLGFSAWRVRHWLFRKPYNAPARFLSDSWRHSVFRTGFEVRDVENPALVAVTAAQ